MKCPAGCSGHGECKTMRRLAQDSSALPLSEVARYDEAPDTWSWDQDSMLACVCDSSWEVGLGSGQRQSSTYFGFDCSLRTYCLKRWREGGNSSCFLESFSCFMRTLQLSPFSLSPSFFLSLPLSLRFLHVSTPFLPSLRLHNKNKETNNKMSAL